jgi:hypothetical protein
MNRNTPHILLALLLAALTVGGFPTIVHAEEPPATPVEEAAPVEEKAEEAAPSEVEKAEEAAPSEVEKVEEEAAEVPEDLEQAIATGSLLVEAVKDRNWALAIGLLMMLLVFGANKFGLKDKVGPKAVPWVAMGVSVLSVVGVGLASGVAVLDAVLQGVFAGVAAIGGWELLFRHLLAKKAEEPAES